MSDSSRVIGTGYRNLPARQSIGCQVFNAIPRCRFSVFSCLSRPRRWGICRLGAVVCNATKHRRFSGHPIDWQRLSLRSGGGLPIAAKVEAGGLPRLVCCQISWRINRSETGEDFQKRITHLQALTGGRRLQRFWPCQDIRDSSAIPRGQSRRTVSLSIAMMPNDDHSYT